ncbi:MAG: hypothetical protein C0399_12490 [Syntrophus sp. (in: bacteria)]|nr:hypothetical protein [Syntrophus sp. (in: bacteria)]
MIPTEKLGEACFSENLNLFANLKTEPEKYNLYKGLQAMSQTIEVLSLHVHKLEMRLDSMNQKLDEISWKLPPK